MSLVLTHLGSEASIYLKNDNECLEFTFISFPSTFALYLTAKTSQCSSFYLLQKTTLADYSEALNFMPQLLAFQDVLWCRCQTIILNCSFIYVVFNHRKPELFRYKLKYKLNLHGLF